MTYHIGTGTHKLEKILKNNNSNRFAMTILIKNNNNNTK